MKKLPFAFIISSCLIMQACNDNSTKNETTTGDTTSTVSKENSTTNIDSTNHLTTDTVAKNTIDKESADFMMKAADGGMMEVELGKIAQSNAKSQRVKDFGSMMVSDHSKANDELKTIASSKNVMISTSLSTEHQKHIDMMKTKKGTSFDNAYMNMMLDDHKKDVSEFKKTAEYSKDADVKNFATKTLPVLQKHLDSAQAMHAKM